MYFLYDTPVGLISESREPRQRLEGRGTPQPIWLGPPSGAVA